MPVALTGRTRARVRRGFHLPHDAIAAWAGRLTTQFRLYNGGSSPLPITPDDIWLALGYVENPPGPRSPAEGMEAFALLPGQAADVELVWLWSGEPYGRLGVGAWRFAMQATQ